MEVDFEALRQFHNELRPEREKGEFTVAEYSKANNVTRDVARVELKRGVELGKFTKLLEKRLINRCWVVVYKRIL
jgi:hypothetical protein